jgi:hypothetical protein
MQIAGGANAAHHNFLAHATKIMETTICLSGKNKNAVLVEARHSV